MIINKEQVSLSPYSVISEVMVGALVIVENEYCIVTDSYDSDMCRQVVCLSNGVMMSLPSNKNVEIVSHCEFTVCEEI